MDVVVLVEVLVDVLVDVEVLVEVLVDESLDGVGGTVDDVVVATSVVVETSAVEVPCVVGGAVSPVAPTGAIADKEVAATTIAVIEYGKERLIEIYSCPGSAECRYPPDCDQTPVISRRTRLFPLPLFSILSTRIRPTSAVDFT